MINTCDEIISAGWRAAGSRNPSIHVPLLCILHYIWLFFHAQSLYRRYHRELQRAEKEGKLYKQFGHIYMQCRPLLEILLPT